MHSGRRCGGQLGRHWGRHLPPPPAVGRARSVSTFPARLPPPCSREKAKAHVFLDVGAAGALRWPRGCMLAALPQPPLVGTDHLLPRPPMCLLPTAAALSLLSPSAGGHGGVRQGDAGQRGPRGRRLQGQHHHRPLGACALAAAAREGPRAQPPELCRAASELCTASPSSLPSPPSFAALQCQSVDMLEKLLHAGVTCARVNLSWCARAQLPGLVVACRAGCSSRWRHHTLVSHRLSPFNPSA